MNMYVVANRVPVAAGWEQAFEERFRHRAGRIEQNPGFIRMEVLRPADEESPWIVLTHWESEDAFRQWLSSDDFKEAHNNPLPHEAYTEEGRLERHEVVIASDGAATK
jgi:heme-degrading monooxygenase HmoA